MKRKWIEGIFVLLLMGFSFFYTQQVVNLVRKTDPIMKQIEKVSQEKQEKAKDAVIQGNTIIPGYNGKEIDQEASFEKMKQYGKYNESLLVFEEISPTVSMDEYYDKYIASGNTLKEKVSLVFEVKEKENPLPIMEALDKVDARGTFFVDGKWLEENRETVLQLLQNDHEVEVLSYQNQYDAILFQNALDVLSSLSNMNPQYCYAKYDNKEVMDLCSSKKMHTIIPTIQIETKPYLSLKGKVEKGSIISFPITKEIRDEMGVVLNYLKSKGYVMDRLDSLLNEAREEK